MYRLQPPSHTHLSPSYPSGHCRTWAKLSVLQLLTMYFTHGSVYISNSALCSSHPPCFCPVSQFICTIFPDSIFYINWSSLVAHLVTSPPAMKETWIQSLGREDRLEKEMTTHSSTLAWRISRTEEPGGLQSMGPQRVGHDWMTLSLEMAQFCSFFWLSYVIHPTLPFPCVHRSFLHICFSIPVLQISSSVPFF